jgi:hypothetical protein
MSVSSDENGTYLITNRADELPSVCPNIKVIDFANETLFEHTVGPVKSVMM